MRKGVNTGVIWFGIAMLIPTLVLAKGDAAKGKAIFSQSCATCHGPAGKGDGPAAAALKPKPRDLTDKAYVGKLKDADLAKVIKGGGGAVGKSPLMPPSGLNDGDIENVIAYIRTLAK